MKFKKLNYNITTNFTLVPKTKNTVTSSCRYLNLKYLCPSVVICTTTPTLLAGSERAAAPPAASFYYRTATPKPHAQRGIKGTTPLMR